MDIKLVIADKDTIYANKLSGVLESGLTAKYGKIKIASDYDELNKSLDSESCDILLLDSAMYSETLHLDKVKCVIVLADMEDPANIAVGSKTYRIIHKFQKISDISSKILDCFYFEHAEKPRDNCIMRTIQDGHRIDTVALKTIRYAKPDFLLPLSMVNADTLWYDVSNGDYVCLEHFNDIVTVSAFLSLFKNIIVSLTECADWFLNYRCFCLDISCIYINKDDYSIKLLYLPVQEKLFSEEALIKNMMRIVRSVNIYKGEKIKLDLYELLADDNTLPDIKKALESMAADLGEGVGRGKEALLNTIDTVSVTSRTDPPKAIVNTILDDGMDTVLMAAPPVQLNVNLNNMDTVLMTDTPVPVNENDIDTILEVGNASYSVPKAVLRYSGGSINVGLPESINVNFVGSSFTIGRRDKNRAVQNVDFVFEHSEKTKTVSRQHARIEYYQGQYWIVDLRSAHGTFINKSQITADTRFKLSNYDKISFSSSGIDYLFIHE